MVTNVTNVLKEGTNELVIRNGDAYQIRERVLISGFLTAPLEFLTKRKELIDKDCSYVEVCEETRQIKLVYNEDHDYRKIVKGTVFFSEPYSSLSINDMGNKVSPEHFMTWIIRYKRLFTNEKTYSKFFSGLSEHNVVEQTEKSVLKNVIKDFTGQLVLKNSWHDNLPHEIEFDMPIMYRGNSHKIKVFREVLCDGCFRFICPEAESLLQDESVEKIEQIVKQIKEIHPELPIFEC